MPNILNCKEISGDFHSKNVQQYKNIISPFCNERNVSKAKRNNNTLIDSNYGLVYDEELITEEAVVYGYTESIPMYSGDQLENYGFLRIPFRKIPRILLKSRAELDNFINSIENRDENLLIQYRGQNKEFYIDRCIKEKKHLYGDETILEPSLIPSAVRKDISMDDIMPLWNNLLHLYLDSLVSKASITQKDKFHRDLLNFKTNVKFSVFSLAIAQHYGFPSVGLDSTTNIETALFFATHQFIKEKGKCFYKYNLNELQSPPVIYVLAPQERFQLDYREFKFNYSEFLRPDSQDAKFLNTGWGLNKNRCARQIWVALYLDTNCDFGNISRVEKLFPSNDEFANFIEPLIDRINNNMLEPYFKDFYKLN
ncbi:FRG domain-containing protein [Rufibacter tibetensis]|uniref:FRG domain-containing protein n=1 Tax=Rufibacter tibetensis TaxID=512763 RepID=A0A0N7HW90_9BACT|nr:FRG domain-containing protein [Rufibacter tibetensis]ALI98584.1 hypothetical protein DC20_05870 [Rufibacter tibetensis]